jgi:phosphoribosylanthranilate isomerase
MKPRVKICCISNIEEAKIAIQFGASAIGLVGKMPSGPGVIDDKLIFEIARSVPPPIGTFLLTSETSFENILEHHRIAQTNTLQLVDSIPVDILLSIRIALPGIKFVQVVHVIDEESVAEAVQISEYVDAILLDSGNPKLKIKELGGTGRVHNWKLSRKIRDNIQIPVFLAGGLNPENVKQAIQEVGPFGLDVCSGVRTDGKLNLFKLESFIKNIDQA